MLTKTLNTKKKKKEHFNIWIHYIITLLTFTKEKTLPLHNLSPKFYPRENSSNHLCLAKFAT